MMPLIQTIWRSTDWWRPFLQDAKIFIRSGKYFRTKNHITIKMNVYKDHVLYFRHTMLAILSEKRSPDITLKKLSK